MIGNVMVRARAAPVPMPVTYMPVATPAFSCENQTLTSLGRLGYTKLKPIPNRAVGTKRVMKLVAVPVKRLPAASCRKASHA